MIKEFITIPTAFPLGNKKPWQIVAHLDETLREMIQKLGNDYNICDGVAIHKTAVIGHNVTIKAPAIISANCFVGSNSYLRGGVFLAPGAKVGISCEVKTSVLLEGCAIAHFNFVGNTGIPDAFLEYRGRRADPPGMYCFRGIDDLRRRFTSSCTAPDRHVRSQFSGRHDLGYHSCHLQGNLEYQ